MDKFIYPPSLILNPHQLLNWEVLEAAQLGIDHFSILKFINPRPTYVIVGVPDTEKIDAKLEEDLHKLHSNLEILPIVLYLLLSLRPSPSST